MVSETNPRNQRASFGSWQVKGERKLPMTKKPMSAGLDRLNDRLKAITTRAAPNPDAYESVSSSHRRPVREPTYKPAVLVVGGGERLPVVIKNLSQTGAKVEFFQNRELSGRVRLVEQSVNLDALGDVAWQRDGMVGLTFVKR
jgi:hypothetical protein